MSDIRCPSGILFGKVEDGVLEVKCRSERCGHRVDGAVILHQFDIHSGILLDTKVFRDPTKPRKVVKGNG